MKDNRTAIADKLYAEIISEGYVLKEKTVRQEFIARAVKEYGFPPKGASTYHHNARSHHNGEPRYHESINRPREQTAYGVLPDWFPDLTLHPTLN